jgi:1-acyl-sn-glycerol-3-phosphate acyltransferase
MRFLWSAFVWAEMAALTAFFGIAVILAAFLLWPVDRNLRVAQLGATWWAYLCFKANPLWKLEVLGRERMVEGAILCANHASQVDILAISALHGQWRWVSKTAVFWVPFLGWAMKAIGTPGVRRGDKESGQRMLAHCRRWLDRGVSILIFPEGTRSEDGALQAFKPGAFKLALEARRPVVPIVVHGSRDALPKKGMDVYRRARVTVSVLEAIDPAPWVENLDLEGLAQHVRGVMAAELSRLAGG